MNFSIRGHSPLSHWVLVLAIAIIELWLAPQRASAQGQNLFMSDAYANIYKITSSGSFSLFASNLDEPYGMAFDKAGNLYVADSGDNAVYKFSSSGARSTFASGLNVPEDLAFDSSSNLYVANFEANDIIKITPGGNQSIFATNLPEPDGLAFDKAGNLYVADSADTANDISKITPSGTVTGFASGFNFPAQMAFDDASNLYVANVFGNSISKVTPLGLATTFASNLNQPIGLAINQAGDLFDGEDSGINEFVPPSGTPVPFAALPPEVVTANYLLFQPASAATKLTIRYSKNQVIISWPTSGTGFTLETNSNLSTTNWGNYSAAIINNSVTNVPSQARLFFRLVQ
jgi:sugar lactone lactonase YvrE